MPGPTATVPPEGAASILAWSGCFSPALGDWAYASPPAFHQSGPPPPAQGGGDGRNGHGGEHGRQQAARPEGCQRAAEKSGVFMPSGWGLLSPARRRRVAALQLKSCSEARPRHGLAMRRPRLAMMRALRSPTGQRAAGRRAGTSSPPARSGGVGARPRCTAPPWPPYAPAPGAYGALRSGLIRRGCAAPAQPPGPRYPAVRKWTGLYARAAVLISPRGPNAVRDNCRGSGGVPVEGGKEAAAGMLHMHSAPASADRGGLVPAVRGFLGGGGGP